MRPSRSEEAIDFVCRQACGLAARKATLMSVPAANGSPGLAVLVVEDESSLRCIIADSLREAGYIVVETESGEEAIAICRSDMSIDVVFTDINLIGPATGWDVAEAFEIDRPHVSVLFTSGKPIDAARRVPEGRFVPKPYRPADVMEALQELPSK
jgi:CheY-like chemotaxis protein